MKTLYSLFLAAACTTTVFADEFRNVPVKPSQEYKAECGSCHLAFPAKLLPAESWRKVMGGLDKHFGTDASLNAKELKELTDYLVKNASTRRASTTPLRITETAHFVHEHREISAAVLKRPAIKSLTNCTACHAGAEQGDFNEHRVRIPR